MPVINNQLFTKDIVFFYLILYAIQKSFSSIYEEIFLESFEKSIFPNSEIIANIVFCLIIYFIYNIYLQVTF